MALLQQSGATIRPVETARTCMFETREAGRGRVVSCSRSGVIPCWVNLDPSRAEQQGSRAKRRLFFPRFGPIDATPRFHIASRSADTVPEGISSGVGRRADTGECWCCGARAAGGPEGMPEKHL